jgi:hypothetical protein
MTQTPTSETGYPGQQQPTTTSSEFNKMSFLVKQLLGFVRTAILVKVTAVKSKGEIAPVGFVDVQPIVKMMDSAGNSQSHGIIQHLPYFRIQSGKDAIILDPQVGDIGLAVIADRDISAAKANKAEANPGSFRRFDLADGVYLGGILNDTPEQYIQFNTDGIKLQDKNGNSLSMTNQGIVVQDKWGHKITMDSSGIAINGNLSVTGTMTNNGVNVGSTHVHGGVQSGGSTTGTPL